MAGSNFTVNYGQPPALRQGAGERFPQGSVRNAEKRRENQRCRYRKYVGLAPQWNSHQRAWSLKI